MKISTLAIGGLILILGIILGVCVVPRLSSIGTQENGSTTTDSSSVPLTAASGKPRTSASPATENLDSILSETDTAVRAPKLDAYAQSVPIADIPQALAAISAKTPFTQESPALTLLASRWVKADPEGARAAIGTNSDRRLQYLLTETVIEAAMADNPATAQQFAQQMPTPELRGIANAVILHSIAKDDPAAAIARYTSEPNPNLAELNGIFTLWGDRNLDQATKAALKLPHAEDRKNALRILAMSASQKDPASAVAWMDSLPYEMTEPRMRQGLVSRWAQKDPQAAAAYVKSIEQDAPELVSGLAYAVTATWAQSDPKAALMWVKGVKGLDDDTRRDTLKLVMGSWTQSDPKSAATYLISAGFSEAEEGPAAAGIAAVWAKSDPQAALAWSNQLPAGPVHNNAWTSAMQQWAKQDPAKAGAALTNMDTKNPMVATAVGSVALTWIADGPPAAATWMINLPDSPWKKMTINTAFHNWAVSDPEKASAWLSQTSPGPNRDYAIEAFSGAVVRNDPNAAMQWANTIGNPDERKMATVGVLRKWVEADPAKGAAAVQGSSLSPEEKADLLGGQSVDSTQ